MPESTWFRLQNHLQDRLTKDEFQTWFSPLQLHSEDDQRLVLSAPNARFVRSLEASYRRMVDREIAGLKGPAYEVLIRSAADLIHGRTPAGAGLPSGTTTVADATVVRAGKERDSTSATDPTGAAAMRVPEAPPSHGEGTVQQNELPLGPIGTASREPARRSLGGRTHFNSRYQFDSFVVGSSNQFAYAAARAVAESPGRSYNPLYLYGGVGLGKTHLLHAVAQQIRAAHPQLELVYLSAEQFVNELINSIRFDRMPAFRERYRTIDVLLVDDVQFLANKERTQEEFFHTFNTLYSAEKQIILSSDCSPKNIPTLEERLRSRFEWGLIADIQPPDLETKVAILARKAELDGHDLPDSVALFIAQHVKSNVRELEGHLTRVLAFATLTGRPLDNDLAAEILRDVLPLENQRVGAADIIRVTAKHYGLKVPEIKSRNNSKQIAFPRQVAMYLCKQLTDLSYPEIGKQFNDKHHSTVMYSVEKIEKLRREDRELDRALNQLIDQIT